MFAFPNVYTCPKCGTKSNGILCISCLDKDIERDRAEREPDAAVQAARKLSHKALLDAAKEAEELNKEDEA